jgi:hypothetical protein
MAEVADSATDEAFSVADDADSLVAVEQPESDKAAMAARPAAVNTERWEIIYWFSCLIGLPATDGRPQGQFDAGRDSELPM